MQKLADVYADNIYLLSPKEDVEKILQFTDKVILYFSIRPFPEKAYPPSDVRSPSGRQPHPESLGPSNNQMIAYCHRRIGVLCGAGILPNHFVSNQQLEEKLSNLYDLYDGNFYLAVEFSDLKTAEEALERAMSGGFVDIYLYHNGKQHRRYD